MSPQHALHAISNSPTSRSSTRRSWRFSATTISCSSLIRDGASGDAIDDYVAWTVADDAGRSASRSSMPAAPRRSRTTSAAFRSTMSCPTTASRSRRSSRRCSSAVAELGMPHPLHVHCNNLGVARQRRNGAGDDRRGRGPAAAFRASPILRLRHRRARAASPRRRRGWPRRSTHAKNVTIDVGQVMFGQTVTISSDVLRQFTGRGIGAAEEIGDHRGDGNGGGIVPYRYRAATSTMPCNGRWGSSCSC